MTCVIFKETVLKRLKYLQQKGASCSLYILEETIGKVVHQEHTVLMLKCAFLTVNEGFESYLVTDSQCLII